VHVAWNDSRDIAFLVFLLIVVPLGIYLAGLQAARREQSSDAGVREGVIAGIVLWVVSSATEVGFSLIAPDIYARQALYLDYFGATGITLIKSCLVAFLVLPAAGLGGLRWRTRERLPSHRRRFPGIALGASAGQVLFIPLVVAALLYALADPKSAVTQASVWSAVLGLLIILIALSIAAQAVRLRRWGWLSVLILSVGLIFVGLPALGAMRFGIGSISERSLEKSKHHMMP
jgi:hypothetical protein